MENIFKIKPKKNSMKLFKLFCLSLITLALSFTAQAQVQMIKAGKRINMIYPDSITVNKSITFPTFELQTTLHAATQSIAVNEFYTYVRLDTMNSAVTLNLVISPRLTAGAVLQVEARSDTTARALTFGTGFQAVAMSGTISKTRVQHFIYDGSKFIATGAPQQID
jgi:hypothetical protein